MSSGRLVLAAVAATVRRDAEIYLSYRLRLASQVLAVLLSLTLFYYLSRLVRVQPFGSPAEYFAFVVAGVAVLEVLSATVAALPAAIRSELLTGTFERPCVSPFGPVRHVAAMALWPVALAFVMSTMTIVIAAALFGLSIDAGGVLLLPPALVLSALAFLPLSLLLGALVLLVKQAAGASAFVITALSLCSGAFFPRDLLPGWIAWLAEVQPLAPALELIRHQLEASPVEGDAWLAAVKLAGFAAVLTPVALVALRAAVASCRRRGTLTEY